MFNLFICSLTSDINLSFGSNPQSIPAALFKIIKLFSSNVVQNLGFESIAIASTHHFAVVYNKVLLLKGAIFEKTCEAIPNSV